jgi:uncharacterized membrane-anchored protein YhcB (DUF1043 family)
MEKEKVVDSFLAGLEEPNVEVGDELALFPDEEEVKEVAEDAEKRIPYFKDEKVQRFIQREIKKGLEGNKSSVETLKQEISDSGDIELVKAFEALTGNQTPEAINALNKLKLLEDKLKTVDERATRKAIEKFEQLQNERIEAEEVELEEAVDELDEGRDEIESHFGKPLTEKQWEGYKDYLLDIEPKGGYQEYPDFIKTFDYFRKVNSRSNATAKTLASRSMERSAPASNQEAPKGNSWKDWEAEKEKLLNR